MEKGRRISMNSLDTEYSLLALHPAKGCRSRVSTKTSLSITRRKIKLSAYQTVWENARVIPRENKLGFGF